MDKRRKLLILFGALTAIVSALIIRFFADILSGKSITGLAVNERNILSDLMIPSAITSIFLSMVGLIVILSLIIEAKIKGQEKTFPFSSYIAAVSIIFVIYGINYFITLFPYGSASLAVLVFIFQIMTYGILLPYILVAQIDYIILLLEGKKIKGMIK
jgi:hypothetical protein